MKAASNWSLVIVGCFYLFARNANILDHAFAIGMIIAGSCFLIDSHTA
jgi:hypothetical protein